MLHTHIRLAGEFPWALYFLQINKNLIAVIYGGRLQIRNSDRVMGVINLALLLVLLFSNGEILAVEMSYLS